MIGARALTTAELHQVLDACPSSRERALVAILAYTAARLSEGLALTWGQVRAYDDGRIGPHSWRSIVSLSKRRTKGQRHGRQVAMHPELRRHLAEHYNDGELHFPTDPIVGSRTGRLSASQATRLIRAIFDSCNLEYPELCSSHSLRKWCATEMLRNGAPIRHVQQILGHVDLKNIVRYAEGGGPEDLARAISLLGGSENGQPDPLP